MQMGLVQTIVGKSRDGLPVCGCAGYRSLHLISEVLYLTVYVIVVVPSPFV